MLVKVKIINDSLLHEEDDVQIGLKEFCDLKNGDIVEADFAENECGKFLYWIECGEGVTYLRDGEYEVIDESSN